MITTTLHVEGANCPTCFDETLEALRRLDGVRAAHGSVAGPCIEIDHDGVDVALLTRAVDSYLHCTEMVGNEIMMVPVHATEGACSHRHGAAAAAPVADPADAPDAVEVADPVDAADAAGQTLASLVTRHPGYAAVFERHQLDYCCHGQRTLADAAAEAGADLAAVTGELAALGEPAPGSDDWIDLDPEALAAEIVRVHHAYLWRELPRLAALVDKIAAVHGAHHPELATVRSLFRELRTDLEPHLTVEETYVFPRIGELVSGSLADAEVVAAAIEVLAAEHDEVGELLSRLRTTTGGYWVPADGCASYAECYRSLEALERDLHEHVHKENNVLLPRLRTDIGEMVRLT